jgi:hypothetical protein
VVYSVHFQFPTSRAIQLVDPAVVQLNQQQPVTLGASPEWVALTRNETAAYVRGEKPTVRVVFRGSPAADGEYSVGADGSFLQMKEMRLTLTFDPTTGLSAPVDFKARNRLPKKIGFHDVLLRWYARMPAHCPLSFSVGDSPHRICTSWRPFTAPPAGEAGLPDWVYRPLMEWTCQWAAGLDDELAICDAIIANVGSSGLQYGVPGVYQVRDLLLKQGGMCGAWYQTFQHMAHCQGVFVYRRRFLVDLRPMPGGEEHWCAIVICAGGLNQLVPTHPPADFSDNHSGFPIPAGATVPLSVVNEPRYRFWCIPSLYHYDGHCINFLAYEGALYLFDACFDLGPIPVKAPLPPNNLNVAQGGADLAPLRAAYLDSAIDYMLGTIRNGQHLLVAQYPDLNGMTVPTAEIPEVVNGNPGLTFRWGN